MALPKWLVGDWTTVRRQFPGAIESLRNPDVAYNPYLKDYVYTVPVQPQPVGLRQNIGAAIGAMTDRTHMIEPRYDPRTHQWVSPVITAIPQPTAEIQARLERTRVHAELEHTTVSLKPKWRVAERVGVATPSGWRVLDE